MTDITNSERVEVLKESSRDSIIKHKEKKELLLCFVAFQNEIITSAGVVDVALKTCLREPIATVLLKSKRFVNQGPNNELSEKMVHLFEPCQLLLTHLLSEEKSELERMPQTW